MKSELKSIIIFYILTIWRLNVISNIFNIISNAFFLDVKHNQITHKDGKKCIIISKTYIYLI